MGGNQNNNGNTPIFTLPLPGKKTLAALYESLEPYPKLVFGILVILPMFSIVIYVPQILTNEFYKMIFLCILIVAVVVIAIYALYCSKNETRQSVSTTQNGINEKKDAYGIPRGDDSQ